jgi:hypothetical protein
MSRYTVKNPLWSEMNTIKSVIYKHHNQHGKEKYFQGIKRVCGVLFLYICTLHVYAMFIFFQ